MSQFALFLVLGIGAGAVYTLLGLGLVLKYRSSGVVDFGHAAVAMFCAYVYVGLQTRGVLELPWVLLPHEISVGPSQGMPQLVALALALVYSGLLGLLFYVALYRPLRNASALARVGASVGVLLYLQATAVVNFGTFSVASASMFPSSPLVLAGIPVPTDRLWLAAIVIIIAVVLAVVYRVTRFGLATTAVAENERGAALLGWSPNRISAWNWVISTVLAALAGILILPITTLNPGTYTLFIVPALGITLLARFSSFTVTVVAGLALGMFESELTNFQAMWSWLPQTGLQDTASFLVIIVAVVVFAKRLPSRGGVVQLRGPSVGRPRRPFATAGLALAIGGVALIMLAPLYRSALISTLITACLCFSVVVVAGYLGQISLAQSSLSGVSAFMLSHFAQDLGIGFPFGFLLSALCATVLGLVIGLPALRVRGVQFAIVTLAMAAALDSLVFNASWFSGGYTGRTVPSPEIFGVDLGISENGNTLVFGLLVLVIVVLVGLGLALLRNGPIGRRFLAVRSNERAAAAAGINVVRTKLLGFAIAAFVAGVGGALLGYQQATINAQSFSTFTSLTILSIAYIGGVGRIFGALLAGLILASNGLMPTVLSQFFDFGTYQPVIAGLAMMATAVANPDGIATDAQRGFRALAAKVSVLSRNFTSKTKIMEGKYR
ncbi:MAG: ABC transporter permease [Microbacterium sp.]|uniref:ABC transporter permease n=1 Tax=Microbacterium sp. TaxID=51671 RepID=UPI0039E6528A